MQKLTEETVAGKNDKAASTAITSTTTANATADTITTAGAINAAASIKRVYICSPLSPQGRTAEEKEADWNKNIDIAKKACRLAVKKGCMPYASHLYFTQFLSDFDAEERELGISLGLAWLMDCDELWIIGDRISEGMQREIDKAKELDIPVKHLNLNQLSQEGILP